MATHSTDFLRFSAYSMKDLITRKLSEDTKLTDQIYEGSNASILIDLMSYLYQCLVYQLNNAASESMFSDVQLYKNISRLVKLIGYNPRGFCPSSIESYVVSKSGQSLRQVQIPFYSRVDTGLLDANGKQIFFSTKRDMSAKNLDDYDSTTVDGESQTLTENSMQTVMLYNGQWKLYHTVFTASGVENETFFLEDLLSDSDQDKYVSHEFIDVFIKHYDSATGQWTFDRAWECDLNGIFVGYSSGTTTLFNNETAFKSLYPGRYKVYTVQLNEDKSYSLKFGNGIVGRKLTPGDKVYVFYLDSNGLDGKIDISDVDTSSLKFVNSPDMLGMSESEYYQLYVSPSNGYLTDSEYNDAYEIMFKLDSSTTPKLEEDPDEIRKNAPMWFSTGNRLVTKFDYEYYIKNTASSKLGTSDLLDVKCMNNWEYMASFYKWLYTLGVQGNYVTYSAELGVDTTSSPTRYLSKDNFTRHDYFFADAADANNLYIWMKTSGEGFDAASTTLNLENLLSPIKLMTAELVACKAVDVCFDICASPVEYAIQQYLMEFDDSAGFDSECESYIEITLDDNNVYVMSTIQSDVQDAILESFNTQAMSFGQNVDFSQALNSIYAINGISRVRTVFNPPQELQSLGMRPRALDGLAFASWTNADDLIKLGDDLVVSNSSRKLEDFQFPVFAGKANLLKRIKIIKKSLSTVNTIKF